MWMLYAQEHWTKSYDLKSAVERLYEELGALEFDADHEAINGMERYYTVQQCEELRDKYKIGRKKYSLLKKMWMLYAQEHWTKSYDLKSAVERLYEELGALEFDADHEAINGMERYYTVQQCEELRDKYKIGRKDSLNHSLKLNTIFSSNCCRELSDRFSKGIEICNKYLNGNICLKCLQIQLFSNNLKEEEWIQFHEQRENINKYFQTFDTMWKPRQIGSKTLTFEMIKEKKNLKIEDMSGNEVYLGWESVSEVWSLESVLRYR
ncbi:hypothetical protein FQA39_LY08786 [Lamprigera yunnana]|nr:hypothetical protein FQA39_LY08786 [Lamprigera yunnana]